MVKLGEVIKRIILKFLCEIKLKDISVWRYKVQKFAYNDCVSLFFL